MLLLLSPQTRKHPLSLWRKQQGAALILMAFILGLGAAAYVLHTVNAGSIKVQQQEKNYQTLKQAKSALIAWSVSNSMHPGQMPFPDRNTDGNYDGNSDCNSPTSTFNYAFLIGQLPVLGQTNPCISPQSGIGESFKDAEGNLFWYAVSRNLTHIYESAPSTSLHNPVINPDIVSYPQVNPNVNNYPAIQPEVRSYPWLKVLNSHGDLISDRVAAVIIAPGRPVGDQDRSAAIPDAKQYLDSFLFGGITYSNANYVVPNQAFVMGQESSAVNVADARFGHPYHFNDKLVYITIDELMAALSSRAAAEAKHLLNQYKNKTGQFPYAAPLDARLDNHIALAQNQNGLIPMDGTDSCVCESQFKCACSFKPITKVTFKRGDGITTWAAKSGACSRSLESCHCTGAGSCSNGSEYFSCDATGVCEHNIPASSNRFIYTAPDYADIKVLSGACTVADKQATCNGAANLQIGLAEPSWFKDNLWQDFFYYEWSSTASLQVGEKSGVSALLIATGEALANTAKGLAQSRPSMMINDYLDSTENTNGDLIFDPLNKQSAGNYNDQIFVVAP